MAGVRLFTEEQWRAIAIIERESERRFNYQQAPQCKKQIYGASFADGEYFVCGYVNITPYGQRFGPPQPWYVVREELSGLVITRPTQNQVDALAAARRRIALCGDYYPEMLRKAQADMAEHRATVEAEDAIRKAKLAKKSAPRKISKRARAVFEACEGKCYYCAKPLDLLGKWHIEHKIPRALFGSSEQSNLAAACAPCNHAKRDKTDLEFQAALAR